MLRINVPSTGKSQLTFASFEKNDLPKPPNGIDEEINGDLVLLFDNEEEAVNYAYALEDISNSISDTKSPTKSAINDIVVSINGDEFVQTYLT
ncbi:MAG: hypothetical protein ACXVJC_14845 [Mucilaginibacter sp.]